jgi:hypothetical protein
MHAYIYIYLASATVFLASLTALRKGLNCDE